MNPRFRMGTLVSALLLLSPVLFATSQGDHPPAGATSGPFHNLDQGNLPLAFEANESQPDSTVRFQAHTVARMLFFTSPPRAGILPDPQACLHDPLSLTVTQRGQGQRV